MASRMKILVMIPGRDGCSGYRLINPLKEVGKKEDVIFVKHTDTGEDIIRMIDEADVLVFRQQHGELFERLKEQNAIDLSKKLFVFDLDDDIFNITPFAQTYKWGGIDDVKIDGKYLWKNGECGFDIERNRENLQRVVEMMKNSDLILCTTPHLKNKIIEYSGNENVEVLPNAISNHWKKWPLKKGKEIRIGWTGGATHYIDWHTIKDGLQEVFKKHKNLKLVLQGCKWDGTIKDIPYEFHDWIDFEGHPYKTASLNIDIAIIPLKDTLFNKSKSCIKWYEFSSLGIPSVVSNVTPYKEEVKNEKTALTFNNKDEFVSQLTRLIEDEELRRKIGDNAREWVSNNRNLENIAKDYIKVFKKYGRKYRKFK